MTKLVLRLCDDQERPKSDPNGVKAMDTGLVEHYGDVRQERHLAMSPIFMF